MNERKKQILEAAIKCFAQKGFKASSIQDIADEVGMAKGSIYVYFKSKEDLLASALQCTLEQLAQGISQVADKEHLSPRDRLLHQIAVQVNLTHEHGDFIRMLTIESAVQLDGDMKQVFEQFQSRFYHWMYQSVVSIYGDEVVPYAYDLATMLQAILSQYLAYLVINRANFDRDRLQHYILDRIDEIAFGMVKKGQPPLLRKESFPAFQFDSNQTSDPYVPRWKEILKFLREHETWESLPPKQNEEIHSYLLVLEREWGKPEPNPVILRTIVDDLLQYEISGITELLHALKKEI